MLSGEKGPKRFRIVGSFQWEGIDDNDVRAVDRSSIDYLVPVHHIECHSEIRFSIERCDSNRSDARQRKPRADPIRFGLHGCVFGRWRSPRGFRSQPTQQRAWPFGDQAFYSVCALLCSGLPCRAPLGQFSRPLLGSVPHRSFVEQLLFQVLDTLFVICHWGQATCAANMGLNSGSSSVAPHHRAKPLHNSEERSAATPCFGPSRVDGGSEALCSSLLANSQQIDGNSNPRRSILPIGLNVPNNLVEPADLISTHDSFLTVD